MKLCIEQIRTISIMNKFNLGLCSVSFRNNLAEEVIKAVSEAGLGYIEWASNCHAPYNDLEALQNIVSLQKQYGIKCSSYGTYFYLMHNNIEELETYIKAAKMLGTKVLRLWCGKRASADYSFQEKQELFAKCRKAAKIAERENVILCMEFHRNSFTDTAESSIELMQAVDSPNFKMYWQPTLGVSEETIIRNAHLISPYTVNIHVFYYIDNVQQNLSKGINLWKRYLKEFSSNKTLLLEFIPGGNIETLPLEAKALKEFVNN